MTKTVVKVVSKAKFWASAHAPGGMVVAGALTFFGTCVLVAKGTKKYEEIKDESDTKFERTKKAVVCYAPAGIVGSLSVGCFTGGHYILKKRNVALVAAYKAVDDGFKTYRKNVIEKYGEEEDIRLKNSIGVEKVSVTEIGEDGKKHRKKVDDEYIAGELGGYSFIYDDKHCMARVDDPIIARSMLEAAQESANNLLKARGYITLNEVLRAIGLHECSAGQIVGWQMKGDGDGYIDFGIRQVRSAKDEEGLCYILDFNVDGPIYNDIDKYTRRWGEV